MGPYRNLIDSMCQQYPNIQRLAAAFRFQRQQKISRLGRATILEISSDSLETEVISFEDPLHFQSYLDGTRDASDNGIQRLCILEDVVSDYVESIGSCLMIDPCFFATHLQLVNPAGSYPGAYPCGPPMPSTCNSNKSFSVVFHELVNHVPGEEVANLVCNFHARRKIVWLPEMWHGATRAGVIGRRISFWSSQGVCDNGSYTARGWIGMFNIQSPVYKGDFRNPDPQFCQNRSFSGGSTPFKVWRNSSTGRSKTNLHNYGRTSSIYGWLC